MWSHGPDSIHQMHVTGVSLCPSVSFEQFELVQQRMYNVFGVRLQGEAGGDVLWLLNPQLVGDPLLCQRLRQAGQGGLVQSLTNTDEKESLHKH